MNIILKNIFLGLFGIAVIAMGLIAMSYLTKSDNDFSLIYMTITWMGYIIFKTFSEYKNKKS